VQRTTTVQYVREYENYRRLSLRLYHCDCESVTVSLWLHCQQLGSVCVNVQRVRLLSRWPAVYGCQTKRGNWRCVRSAVERDKQHTDTEIWQQCCTLTNTIKKQRTIEKREMKSCDVWLLLYVDCYVVVDAKPSLMLLWLLAGWVAAVAVYSSLLCWPLTAGKHIIEMCLLRVLSPDLADWQRVASSAAPGGRLDVPGTTGNILRLLVAEVADADVITWWWSERCCWITWHNSSMAWLTDCTACWLDWRAPVDSRAIAGICVDLLLVWLLAASSVDVFALECRQVLASVSGHWPGVFTCCRLDMVDDDDASDNIMTDRLTSSEHRQTLCSMSSETSERHISHVNSTSLIVTHDRHRHYLTSIIMQLNEPVV